MLALVLEERLSLLTRLPLQQPEADLVCGDRRVLELERGVQDGGVALGLRRADRGLRLLLAAGPARRDDGRGAAEERCADERAAGAFGFERGHRERGVGS